MTERRKNVGLACAGGVVEGAVYEIGALCALEEAIEGLDFNRLGVYVGVSSGALITACLANGIPARTLSRAVVGRAEEEALNIRPEVLFTPAAREYGRRLRRSPGALFGALKKYLLAPFDLSPMGALAELMPLVPVGLFDNAGLERYLARVFTAHGRTNDFRRLRGVCLRVIAMHLDTARTVAFGEEQPEVPISKAVQASTALPALYCPVEIGGAHYIDGVARRTVNASLALDAGADLLFCINPIVPVQALVEERLNGSAALGESATPGRLTEHGLPAVLSQTFRAIVHSRMRTGFRSYEHAYPEADIVLIEPDFEDERMFFSNIFSFSNRHAVCERAYQTTRRYLRAHEAEIRPKLEKHGLKLRTSVLDDPARTLLGPPRRPWAERPSTQVIQDTDAVLDRLSHVLDRLEAQQQAA